MELLSSIAYVTWIIILVILGFNALIIVHEFGHFIVARWCGVRCDKFYIWFDAFGFRLFRFKWGQTEYGIGWVPLGGYVKMFGQEDNPGQTRAEIERARLAASEGMTSQTTIVEGDKSNENVDAGDAPTIEEVERYEKTMYAPDSYLAKSIPQRMAIISAGVVMNLIFAFVCATAAYMVGLEEAAPTIGGVVPGSPAWQEGLRPGDKVEEVNGYRAKVFSDLHGQVLGSGRVDLDIKREGVSEPIKLSVPTWIAPRAMSPSLGIISSRMLLTAPWSEYPKQLTDPAAKNYLPLFPAELMETLRQMPNGGTITAVDDQPVASYADLLQQMERRLDQPVKLTFLPKAKKDKKEKESNAVEAPLSATLPPVPMKQIDGLRIKMGEIVSVIHDSDAEKQQLGPGDLLLAVDGDTDIDPLRLPYRMRQKINAGETSAELRVRKANGDEQTLTLALITDRTEAEIFSPTDYIACTPLGIAYRLGDMENAPDGGPGKISEVTFLGLKNPKEMPFIQRSISFSAVIDDRLVYGPIGKGIDLPVILLGILQHPQIQPGSKIRLAIDGRPHEFTVSEADDWFAAKQLPPLLPISVFSKHTGLDALSAGFSKTVSSTLFIFKVLRGFGTGEVSVRGMGGPILIVDQAYKMADSGMAVFLFYLCLIGANLAVMNILPIPMLDGGHLLFLAYEGITGREPNPKVFEILCWMGLFLLLSLMVWVTLLDTAIIRRF